MEVFIHHRRSVRLAGYDYSQAGGYFITIRAYKGECIFGEVVGGEMVLNEFGKIVEDEWLHTPEIRKKIQLDKFIIMPNHLHGIIILDDPCRGTLQRAPTTIERFGKPTSNSIPTIVRLIKSVTTKKINQLRNTPGQPIWQRNYYEHIIRDENDLNRIRKYVIENSMKWELDEQNPTKLYFF